MNESGYVCIACDGAGNLGPLACGPCLGSGEIDEAEWIRQGEIGLFRYWGPKATEQALGWSTTALLTRGNVVRVRTRREQRDMTRQMSEAFERVGLAMRAAGQHWVPTPCDPTVSYEERS